MIKKCYVWILKQRNENNSYDNHNYNNCKGNRNNNTDRKQARLSVVMTLIHTQLCTARWKYVLENGWECVLAVRRTGPLVRVRGPWRAQDHEKVTSNGMARVLSWRSEKNLSHACAGWRGEELQLVSGGVWRCVWLSKPVLSPPGGVPALPNDHPASSFSESTDSHSWPDSPQRL